MYISQERLSSAQAMVFLLNARFRGVAYIFIYLSLLSLVAYLLEKLSNELNLMNLP